MDTLLKTLVVVGVVVCGLAFVFSSYASYQQSKIIKGGQAWLRRHLGQ
jgi:type IV secretory pathway VirB2 component (pilin)